MMSKKPDERFQTAGEVAEQLKGWLADRGRTLGGGHIEPREDGSGVGSGVFSRFAHSPTPPPSRPPSGSGRTVSGSDRDTTRLDSTGSTTGVDEEIGLAPLDDEDVLDSVRRKAAPKKSAESDKKAAAASDKELATASDVKKGGSASGSSSVKARSLIEEELHDPELEQIKRKVAERAQFNPLLPPGYVPPSQGTNWGVWVAVGGAVLLVLVLVAVMMLS
jgi:hypothetical protein